MKSIKSLLRERRARNRVEQYENDGVHSETTVNRDFDGLLTGKEIAPRHRPLLKAYEKSMRAKLARDNSYLTVCLDEDNFAFAAWWVWRDAHGHYIGLTRFEFSDEALAALRDKEYRDEPTFSPFAPPVALVDLP